MPETKVTVKYSDGFPASSMAVNLGFEGLLGGMTDVVFTNHNGVAIIDHQSSGLAEVFVDGDLQERIETPGTITITLARRSLFPWHGGLDWPRKIPKPEANPGTYGKSS